MTINFRSGLSERTSASVTWLRSPFGACATVLACLIILLQFEAVVASAEDSQHAELIVSEFAEIFSPDHDFQFKAGTLDERNGNLWLAVVRQPKGTLFERGADKDLRLWSVGSSGRLESDISVSDLLTAEQLKLENTDPVRIVWQTVQQKPCVVIAVTANDGVHLTTVSAAGELVNDFVALEGEETYLRSVTALTESSVLLTTVQALVLVSYDGQRHRLVHPGERSAFVDAFVVASGDIAALKGSFGPDADDGWRVKLSMSLMSVDDLSPLRTVSVYESSVLFSSTHGLQSPENQWAVLAAEIGSADVEHATWMLKVFDSDLNLHTFARLSAMPYEPSPMPTLLGAWSRDRLIAGYVTGGDLWLGLFDQNGTLLDRYVLPKNEPSMESIADAELVSDFRHDQVFVPMGVYADRMEKRDGAFYSDTSGGVRILRLQQKIPAPSKPQ